MKKVVFLLAVIATSFAGYSQTAPIAAPAAKADQGPLAAFAWVAESHDFGKIKFGVPATHEFKFTNTGKTPLIITNAQASCGCTTPVWSKDLILPGGTGYVKATFNAGTIGVFTKSVTVTANVEGGIAILTIKGEVEAPTVQ
jgi:hypothetical protein